MAAGATVMTTPTGENLVVPRSTGFVSSAIIAEGTTITESDPTLSTVTLGAYKYANYFEVSQELANDSPTNLLDFLARQAALSLGLGATGFGNHLINGAAPPAARASSTRAPESLARPAPALAWARRAPSRRAPTPFGICGLCGRTVRVSTVCGVPDAQRIGHRCPQVA